MKSKALKFLMAILCVGIFAGTASAAEKVKLTVWGRDLLDGQPDHAYVTALIKNFQAANPNIELEYIPLGDPGLADKTKIAMANNTAPDIVQSWGGSVMGGYADAGRLLDLTNELKKVPGSAAARGAMTWKGKIYGVAPFFAIAGIFANEKLFKENGLKMPKSVADIEKAADKLMKKGIQPFACGAKDKWPPLALYMYLVNRYGGDAFGLAQSRKARFDSDAFVKAAQKYQDWVKKGYFGNKPLGEGYGDAQQQMATGKAAMHVTGSWMCAQYSNPKFTDQPLGFYAFPALKGGKGKVTDIMGMTDIGFIASKKSEAKKAAVVKFMKFAMSVDAGSKEPGRISSVPGVKAPSKMTGMASAVFAKAKSVQFWWDQDLPPTVTSPLNDTIQFFFLADTDVKSALTKFEELVEENVGPVEK
ncbi:MAG: extracellular solute-binding protein [Deltaproteobacteria bacterium]|nr:extracellular solute-binding protein [Deltaproteobacteria bacterium]